MKFLSALFLVLSFSFAHAADETSSDKVKMYFNNADIIKIIEMYSKASGQKFVVDPSVRGLVSIFIQEPITLDEAFNQLSSALAINGYAISKQGDTMVIKAARNIQRDLIEVSVNQPTLKPERMYTWVYTAKNVPVTEINRDLRILLSRDGEMQVVANTNKMFITDWTSNLNRVAEVLKQTDVKPDPMVVKLVEANKKEAAAANKKKAAPAAPAAPAEKTN